MVFYHGLGGEIQFLITDSSHVEFSIQLSNSTFYAAVSISAILLDIWTHIAGVYDRSEHKLKIFINGILDTVTTVPNLDLISPNIIARIGAYGGQLVRKYKGLIDEVRFSNTSRYSTSFLPSIDLQSDINTIGLWKFNEGTGNLIGDASDNGNDGTNIGATWSTDVPTGILSQVVLQVPNGGENWQIGSSQNITWTSTSVTNVKLEYTTNNGTSWTNIIASTSASAGSYSWTVSSTPSTECKIKISDVMDSSLYDISDNTFTISNTTFQLTVSLLAGWNMVSIPGLHPVNQDVTTWWAGKDPAAGVFKYSGSYQMVTSVELRTGYWMKNLVNQTYSTGDEWPASGILAVAHDAINGNAGWNLIGGYEYNAAVSGITTTPPGLQESPVYGYNGGYQMVDYLIPGYGYWIKLSASGLINLPGQAFKGSSDITKRIKQDWGKIIIIDAEGRSYNLYAVKGEVELNQYELPPAPPAGSFDIRFSSGRIAEDINSSMQSIEMSGVTYPLTVRVEGIDIRLMDETGKNINVNLKDGEDIVISDATIQKLMVSGELIPAEYALEQNYPNPFNPSTTIEFSLPQATHLKINIYNMLGELVQTLVEGTYEAGYHKVTFNASSLPSGAYIYRIESSEFVQTRKMMLLK